MSEREKIVVEIKDEEVPDLLNVAIAEEVLGFKRSSDRHGHRWDGVDVLTGEPKTYANVAQLPQFARDAGLAISLFVKLATDHDLVPRITIDRQAYPGAHLTPVHVEVAQWAVDKRKTAVRGAGNEPRKLNRILAVSATTVPKAVSRAAVDVAGIELQKYHRALFPARYIVAVK